MKGRREQRKTKSLQERVTRPARESNSLVKTAGDEGRRLSERQKITVSDLQGGWEWKRRSLSFAQGRQTRTKLDLFLFVCWPTNILCHDTFSWSKSPAHMWSSLHDCASKTSTVSSNNQRTSFYVRRAFVFYFGFTGYWLSTFQAILCALGFLYLQKKKKNGDITFTERKRIAVSNS